MVKTYTKEIFKEINTVDVVRRMKAEILEPKEEWLSNLISEFLKVEEGVKEIDILEVLNFLNNDKFNIKKYNLLAIKISKKREKSVYAEKSFTNGLAVWLIQTSEENNSAFFQNLKKFLFDFYPTDTVNQYVSETGREGEYVYIRKDTRQKAFKTHSIPVKAYLIYLVSNYDSSYEAMLKGYCVTSYEEFLTIINTDFEKHKLDFFQIMDILTIKAQLKLLDILIERAKKETLEFIFTNLVENATARKIAEKIIEILEPELELKDRVIALLNSKKKPAREIAVELIIKWKLPETKKLLMPLINDKSNNVTSMIADFLAQI
jgi:hypothetical protein